MAVHTQQQRRFLSDATNTTTGEDVPLDDLGSSSSSKKEPSVDTRSVSSDLSLDAANSIYALAHTVDTATVARQLSSSVEHGLTTEEACARQVKFGKNELKSYEDVAWWRFLTGQFTNLVSLALIIMMLMSFVELDWIEGGVVAGIICFTAYLGFRQEYQAHQSLQSQSSMPPPVCTVVRDDQSSRIEACEPVPGDIVHLQDGDIVPADVRLVNSTNFATNQEPLTGEAKARTKDANAIDSLDTSVFDRRSIAFSSSTVSQGRATGIVVATGMQTERGKIHEQVHVPGDYERLEKDSVAKKITYHVKKTVGLLGTPLQVELAKFGLSLFALAILLTLIVIIIFVAAGWEIDKTAVNYALSVAVAVIPESMNTVLTIGKSIGIKALGKSKVIVRDPNAIETIGRVTDVCSDKTGTLTYPKMLAWKAYLPSRTTLEVKNNTCSTNPFCGNLHVGEGPPIDERDVQGSPEMRMLFRTMAMCNLASVSKEKQPSALSASPCAGWRVSGKPEEIALQVMAMRVGHGKQALIARDGLQLVAEHSFDSSIKRMSVVYQLPDESLLAFTKGATEVLLPLMDVSDELSRTIVQQESAMASEGLRVLCLAYRSLPASEVDATHDRAFVEQKLTFAGLVGMLDPPREESANSVRELQDAGITVRMLTGDGPKTAFAIAEKVGILGPNAPDSSHPCAVMEAGDFGKLSEGVIDAMEVLPLVLAGCTHSTKTTMLKAPQRRKKICIMTGDGTNDAPALKLADVGIAMGVNGSDVSRNAAKMVLKDDNFASIPLAIREGRRMKDNIEKFLLHMLVANLAQIILLLCGLAIRDRTGSVILPLSSIEILWANLITCAPLAIGLSVEPAAADVMRRRPQRSGVFNWKLLTDQAVYGIIMGGLCLGCYMIVVFAAGNGDMGQLCNKGYNPTCDLSYRARSTVYSVLTVLFAIMALENKHPVRSLFSVSHEKSSRTPFFQALRENQTLSWSVLVAVATPFLAVYIPLMNKKMFQHSRISWEWGLVFGSLVCFVALVEVWKAIRRRWSREMDLGVHSSSSVV